MSSKLNLLFILIPFLVCSVLVSAQEVNEIKISSIRYDLFVRFQNFKNFPELNNGRITDIIEDSYGYMWLAGTNGLSRFDGNDFHTYLSDVASNSLPSSLITDLDIDAQNKLYIATEKGLCFYNYTTDDFQTIIGSPTNEGTPENSNVRAIFCDGDSLLWVETLNGQLWKLDQKTHGIIRSYFHEKALQPYYLYHDILRDKNGILRIGGRSVEPMYLDSMADSIAYIRIEERESTEKESKDITFYFSDSKNRLWTGAYDGLFLIDKNTNYISRVHTERCYTMIEDKNTMLWLGTGNGLGKLNPENGKLIMYQNNKDDQGSIPDNSIYKLFEDKKGKIWASTESGLAVFIPGHSGIDYFFRIPGEDNALSSSSITDLAEAKGGKIWIATMDKGIDLFDPAMLTFDHFNTSNVQEMPTDNVSCLLPMENGDLFCGLWAGVGFGKIHADQHKFTTYRYNPKANTQDWYNDLILKNSSYLYIGFWGASGLTEFNLKTGKFEKSLMDLFPMVQKSRLITKLLSDTKNRIWMGTTESGLFVYYPENDSTYSFMTSYNPKGGFTSEIVFDILEDCNGKIWASAKGLFKYDEKNNCFAKVVLNDSDNDLEIYNLLENDESSLWLLTNKGVRLYDMINGYITDYSSLINLNFNDRTSAALSLSDGRIIMGGNNGFVVIDPENIELKQSPAEAFASSLFVFDKLKYRNLALLEKIVLEPNENFFEINIGSSYWGQNDPFYYYYQLEGFNKEWVLLSKSERTARFTNVPSGNYRFKIKTIDHSGNESLSNTELEITINAAFYEKWWFLLLVIGFAISLLLFIWKTRFKSVQLIMHNMELNQKLLRLQMNPHFIFNSLFAIQNYIYSQQTDLAGNYLSDFARLVRLILENSRQEYINMEKEIESINLYLKLQNLRFEDRFSYTLEIDENIEPSEFFIPPMLAQPFLENAIEHGLKNIKYKGEINIRYKLIDNLIYFEVKDNGIGITASRKLQEKKIRTHESLAIEICKERIHSLKKKKGIDIKFSIEETKDVDGNVTGTHVAFSIPFQSMLNYT